MPLTSTQLAELVSRARSKPLPVVSAPPPAPVAQRPVRSRPVAPSPAPTARTAPRTGALTRQQQDAVVPPALSPQLEPAAQDQDFPFGWELKKESWHFHRRFYRVLRRPMHRGEYSYLLHQIRGGHAEQLAEGCWQVTLPDRRRTLMIRATSWRLITILPKGWLPPGPPPVTVGASSPPYADPAAAAAVSAASSPR